MIMQIEPGSSNEESLDHALDIGMEQLDQMDSREIVVLCLGRMIAQKTVEGDHESTQNLHTLRAKIKDSLKEHPPTKENRLKDSRTYLKPQT